MAADEANGVERFSGLKIAGRRVRESKWDELMKGKRYVPVDNLQDASRQGGDNVVAIVVVYAKGLTKTSSGGKSFCVWSATDLASPQPHLLTLLLYDSAFDAFQANPEVSVANGSMFAVLNPTPLADREGDSEKTGKEKRTAVRITHDTQLVLLGTCPSLGFCSAFKKDGFKCSMPCNKDRGPGTCFYHVMSKEAQKIKGFQKYQQDAKNGGRPPPGPEITVIPGGTGPAAPMGRAGQNVNSFNAKQRNEPLSGSFQSLGAAVPGRAAPGNKSTKADAATKRLLASVPTKSRQSTASKSSSLDSASKRLSGSMPAKTSQGAAGGIGARIQAKALSRDDLRDSLRDAATAGVKNAAATGDKNQGSGGPKPGIDTTPTPSRSAAAAQQQSSPEKILELPRKDWGQSAAQGELGGKPAGPKAVLATPGSAEFSLVATAAAKQSAEEQARLMRIRTLFPGGIPMPNPNQSLATSQLVNAKADKSIGSIPAQKAKVSLSGMLDKPKKVVGSSASQQDTSQAQRRGIAPAVVESATKAPPTTASGASEKTQAKKSSGPSFKALESQYGGRVARQLVEAARSDPRKDLVRQQTSRLHSVVEEERVAKRMRRLLELEQQDESMALLEEIMKMNVQAWKCEKCNVTSECLRAKAHCQEKGHSVVAVETEKTRWECTKCSFSAFQIGREGLPTCNRCNQSSWRQVPLNRVRRAAPMPKDGLLPRGEELQFLSSIHSSLLAGSGGGFSGQRFKEKEDGYEGYNVSLHD